MVKLRDRVLLILVLGMDCDRIGPLEGFGAGAEGRRGSGFLGRDLDE